MNEHEHFRTHKVLANLSNAYKDWNNEGNLEHHTFIISPLASMVERCGDELEDCIDALSDLCIKVYK